MKAYRQRNQTDKDVQITLLKIHFFTERFTIQLSINKVSDVLKLATDCKEKFAILTWGLWVVIASTCAILYKLLQC